PRARGLRVNPRKVDAAELGRLLSLPLDPVPWCPFGFTVAADAPLGSHPAHVAGLYYGQDPAAMAVVERLETEPGWRVADVAAVRGAARRQARLVEQTARLVRPGGLLLYGTCTFERDENEDRVAAFLDTHPEWELAEPELRLWPHRDPGEGQYVARLRRRPAAPARAATDRPRSARRPGRDRGTEVERQWEAFVRAVCPDLVLPPGRLLARGSRLYQ